MVSRAIAIPAMSDKPVRKPLQQVLKEAMAAKKQAAEQGRQRGKLRPEKGNAKAMPDAERRRAMSRKVH